MNKHKFPTFILIFFLAVVFVTPYLARPDTVVLAEDPAAVRAWIYTGFMNHARKDGFSATLLFDGHVLVAGGFDYTTILSGAEVYDPANSTWILIADMNVPRYKHSASLLPNGQLLVAGGQNYSSGYLASAEVYDPASDTWTPTGNLNIPRDGHTAIPLLDGRVLVIGGRNDAGSLADAEIYDPTTGVWSLTNPMSEPRVEHTATLLQDGRVLVVGGYGGNVIASAEIYDPATGNWSITGSLNQGRYWHTATLLLDGRVLAVGGYDNAILATAEIYDPASGTWTFTGDMDIGRMLFTATLLADGTVLTAGGWNSGGWDPYSEIFDPLSGTWSPTDSLNTGRETHTATLLLDGRVLVTGGFNSYLGALTTAELFTYASVPAHDNFANAKPITGMPYLDTPDNTLASTEASETASTCSYRGVPYKTIWYAFTPTEAGMLSGSMVGDFERFISIYTGSAVNSLTQVGCSYNDDRLDAALKPGITYYIQIGSLYDTNFGSVILNLRFMPAPPNDNFATATQMTSLPFQQEVDITAATTEPGEPSPSCGQNWYPASRTVWFAFTPSENVSLMAYSLSDMSTFWAVYTGSGLGSLTEVTCRNWWDASAFQANAGTTYYFQVGSIYNESGRLTFQLELTPPPTAGFWFSPGDPSIFETIEFYDNSYDPGNLGIASCTWDFGDGNMAEGCYITHRFPVDGDYTIIETVATIDGRTAMVSQPVSVRTHDVAAVRIAAPKAASAGQTRTITVYLKNNRYPEQVEIQLYRTVPGGYEWVNAITQVIPVRSGNRTTPVAFTYTFTQSDADIGKVSFKAVLTLIDARDALPADNEAISPPTKVQ